MALFTVTDYDKKVYEEELRDFLPDRMIDIHTHIWLESLRPKKVLPGEVRRTVTWPDLVARDNSIEDLMETYRLMFPGKDVTPLIFTRMLMRFSCVFTILPVYIVSDCFAISTLSFSLSLFIMTCTGTAFTLLISLKST